MWESPINMILGEMRTEMVGECLKTVQQCGFVVDKEELAKALMYDRQQYEKGYEDGYAANKWISCEERLPETDKYVLCQGNHSQFIACIDSLDNKWRDDRYYTRTTIIAWMPLPAPYKKGE